LFIISLIILQNKWNIIYSVIIRIAYNRVVDIFYNSAIVRNQPSAVQIKHIYTYNTHFWLAYYITTSAYIYQGFRMSICFACLYFTLLQTAYDIYLYACGYSLLFKGYNFAVKFSPSRDVKHQIKTWRKWRVYRIPRTYTVYRESFHCQKAFIFFNNEINVSFRP